MPVEFSFGILIGGFISIVSFHWLGRDMRNLFRSASGFGISRSAVLFRYYIRFIVTAVVLYFIISASYLDVIGLLIGLSLVIINIVLTIITTFAKKNRLEEVS